LRIGATIIDSRFSHEILPGLLIQTLFDALGRREEGYIRQIRTPFSPSHFAPRLFRIFPGLGIFEIRSRPLE